VTGDADDLIAALVAERRVVALALAGDRLVWMGAFDEPVYRSRAPETRERLTLRCLRTHGPVTPRWLADTQGMAIVEAEAALAALVSRGIVRQGTFLDGEPGPHFVHVAVLDEIQRRQLHARRRPRAVATSEQFSVFLLRRHYLQPECRRVGPPGVLAALELLQGEDFALRTWEQELLAPRVEGYEREWLDRLGLAGEIAWTVFDGDATRAVRAGVVLRENAGWLARAADGASTLEPHTKNVLLHLQLRGASFVQDLARATGLDHAAALAALWTLFRAGLATPDTFSAIVAGVESPAAGSAPGRTRHRRGQARGAPARLPVLGRWSAAASDEPLAPEEAHEARAHLLLARYGVLARELVSGEWSTLRHALMRLEYAGEVVRGYFVEGLSGEQYALEDALRDLEAPAPRRSQSHVLVSLVDPANLWARVFTLSRADGTRATAPRLPTSWLLLRRGRPILLAEGHGRALTTLAGWEPGDFVGAVKAFQAVMDRPLALRPVRRLEVATWNGEPVAQTEASSALRELGFAPSGPLLCLEGRPGAGARPAEPASHQREIVNRSRP
jgi:ATP-dependent Lhr-like helicase